MLNLGKKETSRHHEQISALYFSFAALYLQDCVCDGYAMKICGPLADDVFNHDCLYAFFRCGR